MTPDPQEKPWCESARRAHDGMWVLWRNLSDVETGLVDEEELGPVPPNRRWHPIAVARHRKDLPDLRKEA